MDKIETQKGHVTMPVAEWKLTAVLQSLQNTCHQLYARPSMYLPWGNVYIYPFLLLLGFPESSREMRPDTPCLLSAHFQVPQIVILKTGESAQWPECMLCMLEVMFWFPAAQGPLNTAGSTFKHFQYGPKNKVKKKPTTNSWEKKITGWPYGLFMWAHIPWISQEIEGYRRLFLKEVASNI